VIYESLWTPRLDVVVVVVVIVVVVVVVEQLENQRLK
jgi:hypothetical protein